MDLNVYIGFAQSDEWHHWAATYARHIQRFDALSEGTPCLVIPFWQASPAMMEHLAPQCVLMSGFARSFEDYSRRELTPVVDWLRATNIPTLAICGSHQLLGFLFNGTFDAEATLRDQPMRRLKPGEAVTNPDYHPDYFMERGFYTLTLTDAGRQDALFAGLETRPQLYESHYCEIKALPENFQLLASSPECAIQAIRHREKPLYGVQFHPEDYSERFPDGKIVLTNFLQQRRR